MSLDSDLPLVEAIEILDPGHALRSLARRPYPFLLHSALHDERARWSFFGADPFAVFRGPDYDTAMAMWRDLAAQVAADEPAGTAVPFTGGAVGYWAYDFGRRLERMPAHARDDLGLPDVVLAFYDVVGAYDHDARRAWLFSSGLPLDGRMRRRRAEQRLRSFHREITTGRAIRMALPKPRKEESRPISTFLPEDYRRAVARVKDRIRAGDIFQANLSQRWSWVGEIPQPTVMAIALEEALASSSPAPWAALLGADDHAVASASPERFLELRARRVEARPIKGTRPRSADPAEDRRMREELLDSAKDRAENVMIVDVLRNDLGRVCETGSIEVPSLCRLESFAQVHHLTSSIVGTLRPEHDAFDLLHACFPGGSITGAPKLRAMEILEELEPVRRHVYCGSIGYIDWSGDADWNIAIRTALVTPRAIHFAGGGAVTGDSDPETEYLETLHKAEGMRRALERLIGPVALGPALAGAHSI
jgi:para-aminobenzoate synthetase component 1